MGLRGLIMGLRGLSFGPERADFGFQRADFGLERADLGPERGLGGDVRTDVWKFTPLSYRTSPVWGRCPKRRPKIFYQIGHKDKRKLNFRFKTQINFYQNSFYLV